MERVKWQTVERIKQWRAMKKKKKMLTNVQERKKGFAVDKIEKQKIFQKFFVVSSKGYFKNSTIVYFYK